MELKKYQLRVLDEVKAYLDGLARQQAAGNRHAALDAWETVRVPGRGYVERRNGLGKDMPNFCLKVPTAAARRCSPRRCSVRSMARFWKNATAPASCSGWCRATRFTKTHFALSEIEI